MTYQEFMEQDHFNFEELMGFVYGTLVTEPPADFDARLPAPPFLMIDRILSIEKKGNQGKIIAEQDIRMDAWYVTVLPTHLSIFHQPGYEFHQQ
jgi:3-hydroxyacyl-[acyl-carrier protein] dehydratase/trans-2-decenoyl-[acyl-carrier protein] isomerase